MIADTMELKVAARQLPKWQEALRILREELKTKNPDLLAITEKAYVSRIESLQSDIAQYLSAHPAAVSVLLAPLADALPEAVLVESR